MSALPDVSFYAFILCFSERWIFTSGVPRTFDPPTLLARWPDDDRRSRLVFITRDLNRATVAASWAEMT
jgi:G3E family GTPase